MTKVRALHRGAEAVGAENHRPDLEKGKTGLHKSYNTLREIFLLVKRVSFPNLSWIRSWESPVFFGGGMPELRHI